MVSTTQRFKAVGVLLGFTLLALAGCATTSGSASQLSVQPQGALGYDVCIGSHASRFPGREEVGRVCRPRVSLNGGIF
jgi:hypothetical protein